MKYALRRARRESGIARFERECGLRYFQGRAMKAYKIPGTTEAGIYAQLVNHTEKLRKKYAAK